MSMNNQWVFELMFISIAFFVGTSIFLFVVGASDGKNTGDCTVNRDYKYHFAYQYGCELTKLREVSE